MAPFWREAERRQRKELRRRVVTWHGSKMNREKAALWKPFFGWRKWEGENGLQTFRIGKD